MKIPSEIENALKRRVNSAYKLMQADSIVTDYIIKNKIDVETYDYAAGSEMYVNPQHSADRIREAIRRKKDGGENEDFKN